MRSSKAKSIFPLWGLQLDLGDKLNLNITSCLPASKSKCLGIVQRQRIFGAQLEIQNPYMKVIYGLDLHIK